MAPKKKGQQEKMSLGAFLQDDSYGGSWADEVEDSYGSQPLPASTRPTYGTGFGGGPSFDRGYSRDSFPTQLPSKPPYTAHLGNLSYEATSESVTDFFGDCEVINVRIIEDKIEQRPKGFAYAEFGTLDGLKLALTRDGESFEGRSMRVKIADPPKDRDGRGDMARDLPSWERKGPLADMPSRNNERRPYEMGDRRPPRDMAADDGKSRDFGNWERKGPLSPIAQPEGAEGSRDSSRPRMGGDSFRGERKVSPATWGEGRQEGGPRPPREFKPERPERAPTAAEMDNQWRTSMKPDHAKSPIASQPASEAPTSPRPTAAAAVRPRLNLTKRTVSENPEATTPSGGDSKASPFGAARPIDTATKEREIEEKRVQAVKEKAEADAKAKEEKRLAKEAAEKEAAEAEEKAKAEAAEKEAEAAKQAKEEAEKPAENASEEQGEQKAPAKREAAPQKPPQPRASDSGNWRTASGEQRSGGRGGGYQNAPRGTRGEARGRGGAPRQPRNFEGRGARANGGGAQSPSQQQQPASPAATNEAPAAPAEDPDGWTTVPSKGRRGQGARA